MNLLNKIESTLIYIYVYIHVLSIHKIFHLDEVVTYSEYFHFVVVDVHVTVLFEK